MSGDSLRVLRSFVSAANAQYRAAGLGEHQIHVSNTGQVLPPAKQKAFKAAAAAGATSTTSMSQGKAGAAAAAAPTPTAVQKGGDSQFRISWSPVSGAVKYGIWVDGALAGYVTDASYAGELAAGSKGTVQVDAVFQNGTHSQQSQELVVTRNGSAAIAFSGAMADAVAGAQAAAASQQAPAATAAGAQQAATSSVVTPAAT